MNCEWDNVKNCR